MKSATLSPPSISGLVMPLCNKYNVKPSKAIADSFDSNKRYPNPASLFTPLVLLFLRARYGPSPKKPSAKLPKTNGGAGIY